MKNFRRKIYTITLLSLLWSPLGVQAEAEYSSLPKLDGRIDSKAPRNFNKPLLKSENQAEKSNIKAQKFLDSPKKPEKKITSAHKSKISAASTTSIGTPKLDFPEKSIKADVISDSIRFKKYQTDLKNMTNQLVDLGGTVEIGANIQLFSAKAHNIWLLNELFKKKYAGKTESQLESYKLVQKIVKTANYTKNFWFESNKIKQNQHDIPEQIIQTKLLQIVSDVEQLLELQKIDKALSEE